MMRVQDRPIFSSAAVKFKAFILVRQTNPASLKYIGRSDCVPKPIECKAKTADFDTADFKSRRQRRVAGLVVDPTRLPNVFEPGKLKKAEKCWQEFLLLFPGSNGQPGAPFGIDDQEESEHFGCLTLHGNYIHGDYDLYDIVLADNTQSNLAAVEELHGQPHRRGVRVNPVIAYVNGLIGAPVLQHGGQAQYADHSDEDVDVFCPDGSAFTLHGQSAIEAQYAAWKRQALGHDLHRPETANR
jgi:hypothetical protein